MGMFDKWMQHKKAQQEPPMVDASAQPAAGGVKEGLSKYAPKDRAMKPAMDQDKVKRFQNAFKGTI